MDANKSESSRTIAAWVQVSLFVVTIGSIVWRGGKLDATLEQHAVQLSELKAITTDLLKTQLAISGQSQVTVQRLQDLERRIGVVEAAPQTRSRP